MSEAKQQADLAMFPLERSAYERGAREERARIVGWLRECAQTERDECGVWASRHSYGSAYASQSSAITLEEVAEGIEAGVHHREVER